MANDGTIKLGIELDEKGFKSGLSKLGKAASAAIATSVGAATAAVGALAKTAVDSYAEFEQLAGGIETLFKDSADIVQNYANNAYKTAGMSANQYMSTVTSFSAKLISDLGGNTEMAAVIADKAITDMADNANKMGTDMTMIQNAYQGFAKQNYTMLDNLKLGYGGTQAEMARLINDSGVLGDTMTVTAETVNSVSFDKIVEAIHVVQTEMGIAGATAAEASSTIEGSVNSMKAAWSNLLVGLADDTQSIDVLVDNFVNAFATAAQNIMPRLETTLAGIGTLVEKMAPIIVEALPTVIASVVPSFLNAGISMVQSIVEGISSNADSIVQSAIDLVGTLLSALIELAPSLLEGAIALIAALAQGIGEYIPDVVAAIPELITSMLNYFSEHVDEFLMIGIEIVGQIAIGFLKAIPTLIASIPQLVQAQIEAWYSWITAFVDIGARIVEGIWQGIQDGTQWLIDQITGWAGNIIDTIKNALDIHSPSKKTAWMGEMLDEGIVQGVMKNRGKVEKTLAGLSRMIADRMPQIESSLNVVGGFTPAYSMAGAPQETHTTKTINRNTTQTVRVVADKRGIFKIVKDEEHRRGKSLIEGEDD